MVLDGMEVHPAQTVVVWADIRKCFQTDMTVLMQRKMFLLSQRSVRETCSHAWVENVVFFFCFHIAYASHGTGMGGGEGGLRVWPAASWQLSWISLNPPLPPPRSVSLWDCIRNRKFIQPLSSASLKGPHRASVQMFHQRSGGLFSWRGRSCCSTPNEQLDTRGIFGPSPHHHLN